MRLVMHPWADNVRLSVPSYQTPTAVCHNGYGASALSTYHSRLHTGLTARMRTEHG